MKIQGLEVVWSNVCVSYLFVLFINEGQYLCMCFCFLNVHFVICL